MTDALDPDDPNDPELARALRALAPAPPSDADVYARILPEFVRARQHRRVLTVSAAVAIAVAAVVGVVLTSGVPKSGGAKTARRTTTTTAPPGRDAAANPTPASTPSTAPVSGTKAETFRSAGGSIDVTLGARNVTLVSESPSAGYVADVRASGPTEVDVRFRPRNDGKTAHRIRLRFDSTGNLVRDIN